MIRRRGFSCREMVEIVTEYLEGTMGRSDRKRFEKHISGCPHCREYLKQMKRMIQAVGAIREEDIPAAAQADLLEAFRGWKRSR